MARTENAPQPKYLKDYKAPDFRVEGIDLAFDIREGTTTVTAVTRFTRVNPAAKNLALDGQELVLKSLKLDGEALSDNRYAVDRDGLTVLDVPGSFTLEAVTEIFPEKNTALEGLYRSSGNYCTQCEPEGFRKITYYLDRPDVMTTFTTRIEADRDACPVLLSNGNCAEAGELDGGRHYAVWKDPFPKPCYLFALVAGKLAGVHDTFTTMSGRKVDLHIYVNPGNEDQCAHAMESLKKAMKWDERVYGREYDLDVFHIVAVDDFNFGAMENKSLNIFNSQAVLANPRTATDADFLRIESIVAHEYFHNWTGNRITCRDWFQLSLKEGLTVFRDQCFSADMNSAAVQRIEDVVMVRSTQFPEDASPVAHSVRPDSYIEMNNFYTATVYDKGAEVIRMMHTLLGPETYRKATDLYFDRHDGQAVTCDDFAQCMQDASGIDLAQFKLWYTQAGTPEITAKTAYDAGTKTFTLTLSQSIPDTPGQTGKKPMHIPVATGLLDRAGRNLLPETTRILELKEATKDFVFENIPEAPVPSILRGFSAPVKLATDLTDDDLLFLMAHDTDGFNRWDAGQTYLQRLILSKPKNVPRACLDAFGALLEDEKTDKSLIAKALSLPSSSYLAQFMDVVDVDALHDACKLVLREVGKTHLARFMRVYGENADSAPYSPAPGPVGRRRLRAAALRYILAADAEAAANLARGLYRTATNMTDKMTALGILTDTEGAARDEAFGHFYEEWKNAPNVLDKWFRLQALADREDTPENVERLTAHPNFTFRNPNRLRALVGAFASGNMKWFHRADGAGYRLLSDTVIKVNAINPMIASKLLTPMRQWRRFDADRKGLMEAELRRILSEKDISNDVYEIVSKSLN